ncbi:MAG: ComF family protein [Rhodospirillales bacterium]|nr:ComF family protein [Rhodospirillales bacterium]MDH3914347.1 ComF family protein [Rhodospirillales bacterium]MDH3965620.1 ComF family protein [Rhodospirillales bacterium]
MARPGTLARGFGGLSKLALDALLPPRCLACGGPVDRSGALCAGCWERIDFVAPPYCACCGFPFAFDLGPGTLCGACTRDPPAFERARFVMRYDEASKGLVLGFKHGDRTEGAPTFAAWLARAGRDLLAEADLLIPVPLHRFRLFARRYNQAALLCRALGRSTGLQVVPDLLTRRRNTPPQGRLSPAARRRNVAGAFAVAPARRGALQGRRVLLVDDVMTTGATISACARVLLRAGAAAVDVLVLTRVVRAGYGN